MKRILALEVGNITSYGLPVPDHSVLQAHPTVSSDILPRITHGRVQPRPNIQQLDGDGVVFVDGSHARVDCIIYCTGYNVTFPFFKPEILTVEQNELPLFHRVFHPRYRDLFFIGLLQPLGAIMPLAEVQSQWVSKYLLGLYGLPPHEEMQREIQHEREVMRKRYGNAPRHTMQVDFETYIEAVHKELKRGKKRPTTPLVQQAHQLIKV
jgi:hypothetical protein